MTLHRRKTLHNDDAHTPSGLSQNIWKHLANVHCLRLSNFASFTVCDVSQ